MKNNKYDGSLVLVYTIRAVLWSALAMVCFVPLILLNIEVAQKPDTLMPFATTLAVISWAYAPVSCSIYPIFKAMDNISKADMVLKGMK